MPYKPTRAGIAAYVRKFQKGFGRFNSRRVVMLAGVAVFALVGTLVLVSSHAATPTANVEAENGSLTSCASTVSDSTASGGSAVKFGTCSASTGPLVGLDETGATVPDSNYAVPAGAIFMATTGSDSNAGTQAAPVATLNKAISLMPSGGTIVVRGGVYRDWYNNGAGNYQIASKAMTIQAYPHEQVWFDGSDVVPANQWTSDGAGHWYTTWSTPNFCNGGYYKYAYDVVNTDNSAPCAHYDMHSDPDYPAAADPQMVFVNGVRLQEVGNNGVGANTGISGVSAGTFFYQEDLANQTGRIYIGTDPASHTIELAKRPTALVLGNHQIYNLKGIGFRRYATNEQANLTVGAVYDSGSGGLIENVSMIQNAGQALAMAPAGNTIRRSILAFNGFNGMGANGHSQGTGTYAVDNLVMDRIIVNNNNLEHYGLHCTLSCAASGVKIAHMNGFTVENSLFENTQSTGDGFWCDEACQNATMINNVIRNNGGSGISYEVSTTAIVASNLIYNNGTGIAFGSGNSSIVNNTIVNNTTINLWLYDDARNADDLRGTNVGPDTRDMVVENNIFSSGANGPVTIFKVNRATEAQASDPNNYNTGPNTPGFFTNLDYNSYYRSNGAGGTLVNWVDTASGTDTGSLVSVGYKPLTTLTAAHGWESHGTYNTDATDPFFTNLAGGDYTVRSGSAAYHSAATIPDNVAAALGLSVKTGYSRGAITWPGQ